MNVYLAEVVGTMIMMILGDGVVANVLLHKSKGQHGGWMVITTAWGLAVIIAIFCVGRISGAHLNPAVTLCSRRWDRSPGDKCRVTYSRKSSGRFSARSSCGSYIFHILKKRRIPELKLAVFCTSTGNPSPTFQLSFGSYRHGDPDLRILAIAANAQKLTTPQVSISRSSSARESTDSGGISGVGHRPFTWRTDRLRHQPCA